MIQDELRLGLDLGIGSCGWAVIRQWKDEREGEIVAMGSRTFDVPETAKERTPTNQLRRTARGMRRVLKRRRHRMAEVRRLFAEAGLIESVGSNALKLAGLDPWDLRAEGLERALTGPELAVALGHIAKHRGFKSNSKRDRGANAADESSKMLAAIGVTRERMARYRSVGEMFARDAAYAGRKRNRDGNFDRSVLRDDQAAEVRALFAAQRRFGSAVATSDLERAFAEMAFFQRPLRDSDDLVGPCPFEPGEKRAARRAPSFERFRLLSRLAALRVGTGRDERSLTADQMGRAEADFGHHKKFSYTNLRKVLGLDAGLRFVGVAPADEKNDFVARSGNAAEGTASLRDAIVDGAGELAWLSLLNAPETLDAMAAILTFRDDLDSIRQGLAGLGLDEPVLAALARGVENGRFAVFKGAGHLSAVACRKIVPFLRERLVYSEACARAGYDHAARPKTDLAAVNNPVARKALIEALKQVKAIVAEFGLPGAIHVELARDVGKSKDERDEIKSGIEKRNKVKDRLRDEFLDTVGAAPAGPEDLMRFELWKEQGGRCVYTDRAIDPHSIVASDNAVQVDHILPWSRSGDDSFVNKTLCLASANQEKKGRTPFEWFGTDDRRWEHFVATVEGVKGMKGRKKRNYLLRDATVLVEKFKPRNLNDTRYACRLLLDALKDLYPKDDLKPDQHGELHRPVRVLARPGPLTDRLRRAWGVQALKKGPDGKRVADDRHHALDALIVAATTNSALIRLTKAFQDAEALGSHRDFSGFPPPWPGFVEAARAAFEQVFVSRAERRRARGEAHGATIRAVGEEDGKQVVYERKAVDKLTLKDLDLLKNPERNKEVIAELRRWIEAGKPASAPPVKRFGGKTEEAHCEPIRKVSLRTNKKPDVLVRDGAADRGEMTRVDVFKKKNKRGIDEYFLVPIYPHQIFDAEGWPGPPDKAVVQSRPESEWSVITGEHEFCWSFYPLCFVLVELPDRGIEGYFRGLDRSTGAIHLSRQTSNDDLVRSIGVKTAKSVRKFAIDRLGRRFEIRQETRTWRGAACT